MVIDRLVIVFHQKEKITVISTIFMKKVTETQRKFFLLLLAIVNFYQ